MATPLSKRDGIVPFDRPRAQKWTRVSDYARGSGWFDISAADAPDLQDERGKRLSRLGLWIPLYSLILGAVVLWMTGAFDRPAASVEPAAPAAASAGAESSQGLTFGLCDRGGGTNCVIDGESFYLDGKIVRVAGIDAPATHSAGCDAESLLGWAATERLHAALNSGKVTTVPVGRDVDANGRQLRQVQVDGRNVGRVLVAAGLARPSGEAPANWC